MSYVNRVINSLIFARNKKKSFSMSACVGDSEMNIQCNG